MKKDVERSINKNIRERRKTVRPAFYMRGRVNLGIGERVLDDQSQISNQSESEDDSGFFFDKKLKSFTITDNEIVQQEFPFL